MRFRRLLILMICVTVEARLDAADTPAKAEENAPKTVAEFSKGMRRVDGFVPLYWDARKGKLYLEVTAFDREFLYQEALASGLGSNPVGLDRGQLGDSRVVVFRRVGPKILLIEPNQKYRALTDRRAEKKAVEDSFAPSVLAGFAVEAEDPGDKGGHVLVDVTAFFLRDAHGVADSLRSSKQGSYRLDDARSALDPERLKGFPKNTEVEAVLTYAVSGGDPGPLVSSTAQSGQSVTVRQRHSLVALPELSKEFTPRPVDPRVGVFGVDFYDFAAPLDHSVEKHWAVRHRLVKKDPAAAVSEPVEPIVYYVDAGTPEPVRSALVEGASWWAEAFEAAGFRNAFKVAVLPDDADPMDLRYNMIHWVHRSTRGWSYGNTVVDPRTGEILKGRVTLDSLRARQDMLIGGGLVGPGSDGSPGSACAAAAGPGVEHLAALDPAAEPSKMVLARIRQLSAHEVGHTLGLAHNFAASTYGRASVMDYPAPLVLIKDGRLDLSEAYARGIGTYDKFAITYAYAQFAPGSDEPKELRKIVRKGLEEGMLFLSDVDARAAGSAHPKANLWDNGGDPVASLRHEMEVRRIGLERFGLDQIPEGTALSELEAKLLPLYFHHRYQLTAAIKAVGGLNYSYAVREADGPSPAPVAEVVPFESQRQAIIAVLDTLAPKALVLPERVLALIPPGAFGRGGGTEELFPRSTGRVFDPVAAASVSADLVVSGLLQPERATRLEQFHARDPRNPGLEEVARAVVTRTWDAKLPEDPRERAVAWAVRQLVVHRLIGLAANDAAPTEVRAVVLDVLTDLARTIPPHDAQGRAARAEIERFLSRPDETGKRSTPPAAPPGDPIGTRGGG
ncbi:MAG: zinc-dependent metalloprotease [Isosphaeraceae bacterium]